MLSLPGGDRGQVGDTTVQGLFLLVGGDGLGHVGYYPVNHVPLGEATLDIGLLQLVVQATLDLGSEKVQNIYSQN